jgi:hypothetical protein
MEYKVFNFKSLKIVLGKTGTNSFVGYSVDTKYPGFSRPIIRGSAREVVEVCIYLYTQRLLVAYNCEWYEVPSEEFNINNDADVKSWVEYVLNRYFFSTFRMYYEHRYIKQDYVYVADDGTMCSLVDYDEDGITIKYWNSDSEFW